MEKRNQWASRLGFVLATAGAAIGLGNLWKFPYLMGKNGGFRFLTAYLIFVVILGIPVMIMEMSIGRYTQQSPVNAFRSLNKKTTIIGGMGVLSAFIILSYYSVIGGWLLKYIASYITTFSAPVDFNAYAATAGEPIFWHFIFMACAAFVCYKGTAGIEKASRIMMPGLFILIVIIIVRSLTLPGAKAGLEFMFFPKSEEGRSDLNFIVAALGQVFYSLSLCMGITITFGSYLKKQEDIPKNCLLVAGLDTMMALCAGLAIFPAVFSFGLEPTQGASLVFGTLPKVFDALGGGVIFAILFFILLFFAALTSSIALLECIVSFAMDDLHWGRSKSVIVLAVLSFLLGVPSSLAFGATSDFLILNYNFFDLMGMLTDNILMPIGGIFMCIYVGWIWGPQKLIQEIEQGSVTFRLKKAWVICIRFITPLLIAVVTVMGFLNIYNIIKA